MSNYAYFWDGRLGTVRNIMNRIDFEPVDALPIWSTPYLAGPKARELEKEEIDKLLSMYDAELEQSQWASPIVFEKKKDGYLRFSVKYRRLNASNTRDSNPIHRKDEYIESLGNGKVFSTLDANSGYWQMESDPRDRDKTAFTLNHGLYRFTLMPFCFKKS